MLESVFIMIISMGFILFILGITERSVIFSSTSMLMWILAMAGVVYIEVPYTDAYSEIGLTGVCMAFIIINLLWIIIQYTDLKYWGKVR